MLPPYEEAVGMALPPVLMLFAVSSTTSEAIALAIASVIVGSITQLPIHIHIHPHHKLLKSQSTSRSTYDEFGSLVFLGPEGWKIQEFCAFRTNAGKSWIRALQ